MVPDRDRARRAPPHARARRREHDLPGRRAHPREHRAPPTIVDVDSALRSRDVAYHLSHGRGGRPLLDPATGQMSEGIGHFTYERTGPRRALVTAPGPFPCELDRGIVLGLARRLEPRGSVALDTTRPTLRSGGDSSTYE